MPGNLKYEGQERMVAGDEEDEVVNFGEWCELLDERLVRFDGFVWKEVKLFARCSLLDKKF